MSLLDILTAVSSIIKVLTRTPVELSYAAMESRTQMSRRELRPWLLSPRPRTCSLKTRPKPKPMTYSVNLKVYADVLQTYVQFIKEYDQLTHQCLI